jgi:hypothetical protein
MRKVVFLLALLVVVISSAAAQADTKADLAGKACFGRFVVQPQIAQGANVIIFYEKDGVLWAARGRMRGRDDWRIDPANPAPPDRWEALGSDPVTLTAGVRIVSHKYGHVLVGEMNGIVLKTSTDVSGEFPNLKGNPSKADLTCSPATPSWLAWAHHQQ